jgi:hypothetical protein
MEKASSTAHGLLGLGRYGEETMTTLLFLEVMVLVTALLFGLSAALWQVAARLKLGVFALEGAPAEDR